MNCQIISSIFFIMFALTVNATEIKEAGSNDESLSLEIFLEKSANVNHLRKLILFELNYLDQLVGPNEKKALLKVIQNYNHLNAELDFFVLNENDLNSMVNEGQKMNAEELLKNKRSESYARNKMFFNSKLPVIRVGRK
jgi:hypothetical protein